MAAHAKLPPVNQKSPQSRVTGRHANSTRDEIIGLLESLWRDKGLTIVLVTHDSTVAVRAQRRAMMREGKLTISHATGHLPATRRRQAELPGTGLPPQLLTLMEHRPP